MSLTEVGEFVGNVTPSQRQQHEQWKARRGSIELGGVSLLEANASLRCELSAARSRADRLAQENVSLKTRLQKLERVRFDPKNGAPTVKHVIDACSDVFEISPFDIVSDQKIAPIVRARQAAMYVCRHVTGASFVEIGRRMGKRDHSTILHGFRVIERKLLVDDDLAHKINLVMAKVSPPKENI